MSDDVLLGAVPDFLSLPGLLKTSPVEESGERFLYFEASNEDVDHQGEVVLQKALAESSDFFLRHGNIDLSHFSLIGPKAGIPNYQEYEIGRPVDVQVDGTRTFVKSQLYRGDSAMARNANMVWDSLTQQNPPARWYPSVGGAVLAKSIRVDPASGQRVAVIEKVRWSNVALDRTPVNRTVPEVSMAPVGTFAKSLGAFVLAKDLMAGYGTDSASLTGGAALREQSLHGAKHDDGEGIINYFDFREKLADAIKAGKVGARPVSADLRRHAVKKFGLSEEHAAEIVSRFLRDLHSGLSKKRNPT